MTRPGKAGFNLDLRRKTHEHIVQNGKQRIWEEKRCKDCSNDYHVMIIKKCFYIEQIPEQSCTINCIKKFGKYSIVG